MRNLMITAMAVVTLVNCSSPSDKVTAKAESYLLAQLHDPASFQLIEWGAPDTITLKDSLEVAIAVLSGELIDTTIRKELASQHRASAKELQDIGSDLYKSYNLKAMAIETEILLKKQQHKKLTTAKESAPDTILKIIAPVKYRAANAMGATTIQQSKIVMGQDLSLIAVSPI